MRRSKTVKLRLILKKIQDHVFMKHFFNYFIQQDFLELDPVKVVRYLGILSHITDYYKLEG